METSAEQRPLVTGCGKGNAPQRGSPLMMMNIAFTKLSIRQKRCSKNDHCRILSYSSSRKGRSESL